MLRQNDFSIGSDGRSLSLSPEDNQGKPHPRNYGTFPRFLRLAREKKLCSLETAVRRMTGQSAEYIGLKDRGFIKGRPASVEMREPGGQIHFSLTSDSSPLPPSSSPEP